MNEIYLQFLTQNGVYDIPFKNIEQLDTYTIQFENMGDLTSTLFGEYAKLIDDVRIRSIFKTGLNKETGKKEVIKEVRLPIKYYADNFNENHLKFVLKKYLTNHPNVIKNPNLHVIYSLNNGGNLDSAINDIWKKGGYKKKRDIYFVLKELGCTIEIVPTLSFSDRQPIFKERLSQMNPNNQYIEYLQSHAKHGEEEMSYAMEQLSMFDLDELSAMNAPIDASISSDPFDTLLEHIETLSPTKRAILSGEIYKLRDEFFVSNRKKYVRNK